MELHFCYAKVVACGRVIEREWGNPSKVPPSHSPFLAMCRGADNKICTQSQKKHYLSGWCFLFGMPRAGLNSLPRPARSALNQEVRQGSCEWLCHSWDAGSESSFVTFFAFAVGGSATAKPVSSHKKERHPHGCLSFLEQHFCYAKVVACGRMTEREWMNPSKVPPPHTPPFLRCVGVRTTKSAPSHKRNTIRQDGVFFLECRGQARTRCLDRRGAR